MTFSLYLPDCASKKTPVPTLYWLSGLTCSDDNFSTKSGAQRYASQHGIALVIPDTSPRGDDVADDPAGEYDLGLGASFYVNATQAPWKQHYQMYDYILEALPSLLETHCPINQKRAIAGHSMGGHGALMLALRNPTAYQSVSALSPICQPMTCPWGKKAFSAYLGDDQEYWKPYDSSHLIAHSKHKLPIMIDQGEADEFLTDQLKTQTLVNAAQLANYPIACRFHPDYDHSYYFIASFIGDHIAFHAQHLK